MTKSLFTWVAALLVAGIAGDPTVNQCGNVNWDYSQAVFPANEAQVATAIQNAVTNGLPVKVIGDKHSFSPLDVTTGVMLSLDQFTGQAYHNNGDNTVTVSAGMKLWQLYEALAADGLAMPNSGTQCTQTVAGALATATHGTGNTGSMSSQIVSMRIVLANGETKILSATENADLFNAARVGYGALGIITTVTLSVVPQFKLERIIIGPLPVADVEGYVTKLRGMYDGRVSMTYFPYASTVNNAIIILYAPTTADINECWKSGFGAPVTPAPATVFPDGWPSGTQACVDLSYKAMVLQGGTFEGCPNAYGTAMEMIVPEENAFDVLNWLIQYQNSPDVRNQYNENNGVLGQTDVRFVAADGIWLSPYYNRNAVVISTSILGNEAAHFTGTEAQIARYLRDGLQAIALNYGGRAHPGKQNFFTAELMKQAFDHYCDFVQVRADVDPQGLFSNQWLETLFNVHVATVGAGGETVINCICPASPVCQVAPSANPSAQPSTNPSGTTLTVTAFPAPGSMTPIGGRFTNLPNTVTPTDYKVILYLQAPSGGANWWIKPLPDAATTLAADGSFLISGWATYPAGDVNFASFELYLVPVTTAVPNVLGGPLPSLGAVQLYRTNIPRGFTVGNDNPGDPPATGNGAITLTAFPAPGTLDAIAGTVTGLANPAGFKVIMYMRDPGGNWWIKPYTGQSLPVGTSGAFRADGWASYPPGDVNFAAMQMYVVPLTTPVVDVLGGPLPQSIASVAVASAQFPRGYVVGGVAPSPQPTPPPSGGSTADMTITEFPVPGALTPVTGVLHDVANTQNYKAVLYIQSPTGDWWIKPYPDASATIDTTGHFTFPNWASNQATDKNWQAMAIYIVPVGHPVVNVLGGAQPSNAATGAILSRTIANGYRPGTPDDPSVGVLHITQFPAVGGLSGISGFVTGLPAAATGYKAVLYVQSTTGAWWIKPYPDVAAQLAADGSFAMPGWASAPATDVNSMRFHIIVVPNSKSIYAAMGTPDVPNSMLEAAVAQKSYPAGYPPDTTVTQTGGQKTKASADKSSNAALIGGVTAGAFVVAAAFAVVGVLAWRSRKQQTGPASPVATGNPSTPARPAGETFSSPRPSLRPSSQTTHQPA